MTEHLRPESQQPKPEMTNDEIRLWWDKMMARQLVIANNPEDQEEVDTFIREIQTLSPDDLNQIFDI